MPKYKSVFLAIGLALGICAPLKAQNSNGEFGCPARTQLFDRVQVEFTELNGDGIAVWQNRPGLAFDGFDEKKYGFRHVEFYRWRESLLAEGDSAPAAVATLAVRLVGTRTDHWFEWRPMPVNQSAPQAATPDDLLYIQEPGNESLEQVSDTLAQTFIIRPAAPDPGMPLFLIDFGFTGNNGTVVNRLILDIRSGKPQLGKAAQCLEPQTHLGCEADNRGSEENLSCAWDAAAADFRCSVASPYGFSSPRMAQRSFYLFSRQAAAPDWISAQTPPDLGALAVELSRGRTSANEVAIPGLGPVWLLARYKDLLPGREVFIFASPGAGPGTNAHLSLVTVSPQAPPLVTDIAKAVLSGEKTDESQRPAGYTPLALNDHYHTSPLADRPGFHAFQAVMTSDSPATDQAPSVPVHVVYWIGVEAVEGKLVASAMRVASDGLTYGSCARDAHDGSAISIEPQAGMAAATVHVRPPDVPLNTTSEQAEQSETISGCVWIGALYWKPQAGFQAHKTDDDCSAGVPQIHISDNGQITVNAVTGEQEQ